jgi:hypothetical protein
MGVLPISRRLACFLVLVIGWHSLLHAGDDQGSETVQSARSLKRMQRRVASLSVERRDAGEQVELKETAVLRYSNPGGLTVTTDGAVWVWGKVGRPIAISAIFFEQLSEGGEKWSCELTSLADEELLLKSPAGWKWSPTKSDLQWTRFPDSPPVAETAALRTRQLKDLARRFTASESFGEGQTDQLRLLTQPLYRYAEPDHDLVDGALMAFAAATNPEVVLLLEARRDKGGKAAWHFAFARMGAAAAQARMEGKVIWECAAIKDWKSDE